MSLEKNITMLINYINSLKDFNIVKPAYPYNHMGATITDAMLQAGLKWESVVEPRVKKLLKFPEAKTTKGFRKLLDEIGAEELLEWSHHEKLNRLNGVVQFFRENEIETVTDLKNWLEEGSNINKLKELRGIGNTTADYFRIWVFVTLFGGKKRLLF